MIFSYNYNDLKEKGKIMNLDIKDTIVGALINCDRRLAVVSRVTENGEIEVMATEPKHSENFAENWEWLVRVTPTANEFNVEVFSRHLNDTAEIHCKTENEVNTIINDIQNSLKKVGF